MTALCLGLIGLSVSAIILDGYADGGVTPSQASFTSPVGFALTLILIAVSFALTITGIWMTA